jgi:hypothetical protein
VPYDARVLKGPEEEATPAVLLLAHREARADVLCTPAQGVAAIILPIRKDDQELRARRLRLRTGEPHGAVEGRPIALHGVIRGRGQGLRLAEGHGLSAGDLGRELRHVHQAHGVGMGLQPG